MIFVYRNLHRSGVVWSVKSRKSGMVVARSSCVIIKNATLKVSQAGRKRVLFKKCKNVHAGIEGTWVRGSAKENILAHRYIVTECYGQNKKLSWKKVSYNPYKNEGFIRVDTGALVTKAEFVILDKDGAWAFGLE